ncbi:MAG: hypothetical protein IT364_12595 [Candidatus Hydrogenedentes bacterium]|nr:hypothetical protein [Candidatus Hydrogenedentota bacterium]
MRILRQLAAKTVARWHTMPRCERYRCGTVSILVPLALWLAFETRPQPSESPVNLVTLASGLDARESDALRAHLELRRVPYQIWDGGQTVMVPADRRAELTVELTHTASGKGGRFPVGRGMSISGSEKAQRGANTSTLGQEGRAPAQGTAGRD